MTKPEYLSRYFDLPVAADVDMHLQFEQDCARLERVDQDIDITVADFICTNIRRTKLFHCADHPANALYFYQMDKMIDLCAARGTQGFEDPRALRSGLRDVERDGPASFGATEFFGDVQTPLHPDVIQEFELQFCTAETNYQNRGLPDWTHRSYIAAIHDHLSGEYRLSPQLAHAQGDLSEAS